MNRSVFSAGEVEEKIRDVSLFRRTLGTREKHTGVIDAANEPRSREKKDRS
jgi:hypothetical protein